MTLAIEQFDDFFRELWGYDPFPWQTRLAKQVFSGGWPECIDLPTASGKTACIDIAVFVLACQAKLETKDRKVGRRIFFTVNRRVIVDEAFERAKILAQMLLNKPSGILKEVADALHDVSGDKQAPPLDVAQLRGGIYRDRAWARSITQPIVVCTTADQLGSRLLFRGYGVSDSMKPVHAALCGCDSLVLLDEAHVTRAFSQTMKLLTLYQSQHSTAPRMRFVQMTATPDGNIPQDKRFDLKNENWSDPRNLKLKDRQEAPKPATLVKLDKKKPIVPEITDRAFAALSDTRKAIGIIVNRVQTARDIEQQIREEIAKRAKKEGGFDAEVHLVIGRMRPIDRDDLQKKLRDLVGPGRPANFKPGDKAVIVVATQCLEVGADYDFDALFTECASIDALRQRFGRLNRQGRSLEVIAAIVTNDDSVKGEDPIYGDAIMHSWEWLLSVKDQNQQVDFGIKAFKTLWDALDCEKRAVMLSPTSNAAVLLPALLDALCQTSPQPIPSPDVSYFIHGPQRDNAEVNVCWRADLGNNENLWPDVVRLLPPTSRECMAVPLPTVANWMRNELSRNDADIPIASNDDESKATSERFVLIWRGSNEAIATNNPRDFRPGDTIIVPAQYRDSLILGHIPDDSASLDIAERAYAESRRQRVVRIHPEIHPELPKELFDYAASEEEMLSKARIRDLLGALANGFKSGPDEIDYPNASGLLLRFNKLLPNCDELRPSLNEDDGGASSIESTEQVTLENHTRDVITCVKQAVEQLDLSGHALLFECSADLHDIGKADARFQALLAGLTPYESMERPKLLAKSGQRGLTRAEHERQRIRAQLPAGFRHEMISVELLACGPITIAPTVDKDSLLHLIAAHHGYARPFAPVVLDDAKDETRAIEVKGSTITPEQRNCWISSHRLDSGIAERFWKLTRQHGWWGLAWLESILRLADQQASAAEQERAVT
jgi:CRISPR-associated endonuclease/helicase Cas3